MLDTYRPRQAYLLLDEQRLAKAGPLPERNLCAALFRLEASRGASETMGIVQALVDWLRAPEQTGLRRAFAVWFGRVLGGEKVLHRQTRCAGWARHGSPPGR